MVANARLDDLASKPEPAGNGASPLAARPRSARVETKSSGTFGSLSGLSGGRKFKKKPVLVLDPDELVKAHQLIALGGSQMLEEEEPQLRVHSDISELNPLGGTVAAPRAADPIAEEWIAPEEELIEEVEEEEADPIESVDTDRLLRPATPKSPRASVLPSIEDQLRKRKQMAIPAPEPEPEPESEPVAEEFVAPTPEPIIEPEPVLEIQPEPEFDPEPLFEQDEEDEFVPVPAELSSADIESSVSDESIATHCSLRAMLLGIEAEEVETGKTIWQRITGLFHKMRLWMLS